MPINYADRYTAYLKALRYPFIKLCRLRFMNPDGSTAFVLDNDPKNKKAGAFISSGNLKVNLQNGQRRSVSVTLSNVDGAFDYDINHLWFGQEIALDEGLILPDGTDFYIQQGVFVIGTPTEQFFPNNRTITYELVDKWSNLDGTLFGNLEATHVVAAGTNIFQPITALLAQDRGNGYPVDSIAPTYTSYYNSMSQELPDRTTVSMVNSPYELRTEADNGSFADVILGLTGMVNAWVGYDSTGSLRVEPSQDDILDADKPLAWRFKVSDIQFLGAAYTVKNTEVYNDYIVVGAQLDDYSQPYGRAYNTDPASTTNIVTIGRKTIRESQPGYASVTQCRDLAVWKLKRSSALQKAVSISCGQIFHISENELVEIVRTDKPNEPVERHLIMGFTRPLTGTEPMTIDAVSIYDLINTYEVEPPLET